MRDGEEQTCAPLHRCHQKFQLGDLLDVQLQGITIREKAEPLGQNQPSNNPRLPRVVGWWHMRGTWAKCPARSKTRCPRDGEVEFEFEVNTRV